MLICKRVIIKTAVFLTILSIKREMLYTGTEPETLMGKGQGPK
jgi:hypothetical protein